MISKFSKFLKFSLVIFFKIQHSLTYIGDKLLAKRKGENFSRIKPSTVSKLINTDTNPESIYNINQDMNNLEINDT